jgi:hypothetical protein
MTCNKCNKSRKNVLTLTVSVTKEGNPNKRNICPKCLKDLFIEIVTWNTDILNKAFNNTINWNNRNLISDSTNENQDMQT